MRIGINALILKENNTGTGYYTKCLIEKLQYDTKNEYYIFLSSKNLLNSSENNNFKIYEFPLAATSIIFRILIEQFLLKRYIKKLKIEILHSTSFSIPLNQNLIPNIVTIHDIFHEKFKKTIKPLTRIYHKIIFNASIKKADFIIADSKNTKEDIINYLGIDDKKITVVLLGVNSIYLKKNIDSKKNNFGKYFLYVGSLEPRKNIDSVIKAFSKIHKYIDEILVIVGAKKWKETHLYELVKELGIEKKVFFCGYIADDELPGIYANATALVFPSFYEGFGLPVIEAMAAGTAVITSNNSSLSEISNGASLLVDPYSIDEISIAMKKIVLDTGLKEQQIAKGLRNSKNFTWEKTAEETIDVYKKIYKEFECEI